MAKKQTFESEFSRLEEISSIIDKGNLTLDQSLKLYEEGTEKIRVCNRLLDEAKQKVMKIRNGDNGPEFIPFNN